MTTNVLILCTHNSARKKRRGFELTRQAIGYRMLQLLQLALDDLSNADLRQALADISNS